MLNLKNNFKNGSQDTLCNLCKEANETQEHLLSCKKLANTKSLITVDQAYEDIFSSDPEKQIRITKLLMNQYKIKREKENK